MVKPVGKTGFTVVKQVFRIIEQIPCHRRTSTQGYLGLPRIDSHDCVRRHALTFVNVRWRRTSAYIVLVALLRWRRSRLVLGIFPGLNGKTDSPTTQESYNSVWPRHYWQVMVCLQKSLSFIDVKQTHDLPSVSRLHIPDRHPPHTFRR